MRHGEQMLKGDARVLGRAQVGIFRKVVDNRGSKWWKPVLVQRYADQKRGDAFRDRADIVLYFRRELHRFRPLHPAAYRATKIALEHEFATPHDDDSVNVTLGPMSEKCV